MPSIARRTRLPSHLLVAAVMPFLLLAVGTIGYRLVEGWPLLDALYMTAITLTTVGYREVHPLSRAGEAFTMLLALGGIFTLFYAATSVISGLVRGELAYYLGSRRMERSLAELHDHLIVCGYGRMGKLVCQQFSAARIPFVVVERHADALEHFTLPFGYPLTGDATSDETLQLAGVARCRALIAVVASDADNLYITMSAKVLNERLFIVARAEDERSEQKLLRAGASRVVSPYVIGGGRVAQAVLRPNVVDFLELATRKEHLELNIEEARVSAASVLADRSIEASSEHFGKVILVAIKQADGRMQFNAPKETTLRPRDVLIMLGRRDDLDRVAGLATA